MPEENQVSQGSKSYIGLRDLVFAELLKDDAEGVEYGPIEEFAPSKTASITPSSTNTPEYADDSVLDVISSNGAYTLSLSTAGIDDEKKAKLLGAKYDKGGTEYSVDRISPFVAVGFKSLKADGTYGYVWLLKGKFSNPTREHNTKEDTATPQNSQLEGMFINRKYDRLTMHTLDTKVADKEVKDDYFKKVYGSTTAETP